MKTHLNLLPLSFQRRLVVRRDLIQWGSVCFMGLVIGTICCVDAHHTAEQQQRQLDRLTSRAVPLRRLGEENQRLAERLNQAHDRHLLLQSLEGVHPPLQIMGVVSRSAHNDIGSVQVRSFILTPGESDRPRMSPGNTRRSVSSSTNKPPANAGRLFLQGTALDDNALTGFVNGLRGEGLFKSVELRSSSTLQLSFGDARQYSVECRF